MAGYVQATPKSLRAHAYLLPISSVPLPPSNLGDALMFRPSVIERFKWEEQERVSSAVVMALKGRVNNIFM